jgi:uncharacterized protein
LLSADIFYPKKIIAMKNVFVSILICALTFSGFSQNSPTIAQSVYDSSFAKQMGADEYGMKHYVMAFLKTGPNKISDPAKSNELLKAHLKNIIRLADDGKLLIAGPFLDDGEIEGIFVFNVGTIEEAKALTETDPAIKAGSLVMELRPWYGSAALMQLNAMHKKLQKKSVADF